MSTERRATDSVCKNNRRKSTPIGGGERDKKDNSFKKTKKLVIAGNRSAERGKPSATVQSPSGETPDNGVFNPEEKLHQKEIVLDESQKSHLAKLARQIIGDGIPKLTEEYEGIAKYKPPHLTRETQDAHKKQCRYKDVNCWDQTRIKLNFPPDIENDFIHANYVTHPLFKNKFICTQGPMEHTILEFWRLVWQENVVVVIMLCQCLELKRPKCAQYWPTVVNTPKTVGPFTITTDNIDTVTDPNVVYTELKLEYGGTAKKVEHHHWITWPDKTVPKNGTVAFKLLVHPRYYTCSPSIIHCSAGVGRTGTLLMLELLIQHIVNLKQPSIPDLLKELRAQRSQLIQTEDQYVFMHAAMVQYAVLQKAVSFGECNKFFHHYTTYVKHFAAETDAKNKARKARKPATKARKAHEDTVDKDKEKEKDKPGGLRGFLENFTKEKEEKYNDDSDSVRK
ncbi:unnamed protein product [Bursaphelenchus okinawaensis]|uniref:Tyrosine-protein phosphatase domain-containing protein n=1 Tax=Bursaphelenchus okinawaensis TaxID=465554 RepID=A0A811LNM6_9BILA|nr:unnamed protein product [Bursaphelenchus okinawaensis]CAG9127307.1 unnamed protein product [Bursaphelenchus okinawaensis]